MLRGNRQREHKINKENKIIAIFLGDVLGKVSLGCTPGHVPLRTVRGTSHSHTLTLALSSRELGLSIFPA